LPISNLQLRQKCLLEGAVPDAWENRRARRYDLVKQAEGTIHPFGTDVCTLVGRASSVGLSSEGESKSA
jgi:hypothetical protein